MVEILLILAFLIGSVAVVGVLKKADQLDRKNAETPLPSSLNTLNKYEEEFAERLAKERGYQAYKRANSPNWQNPFAWLSLIVVNIIGYFLFIK